MSRRSAARTIDTPFIPPGRKIDRERHHKLAQLHLRGHEPYPNAQLPLRSLAAEIYTAHDPRVLGPGEHDALRHVVAGRLVARRKHRHATFLDLRDESGIVELCARRDRPDQTQRSQILDADIGDIVTATGNVYVTDNHKLTLSVTSSKLLSKALRSPPAQHSSASAQAMRYHQPELDLLANESTRLLFKIRSSATHAIRQWMSQNSFVEVEAPVLQPVAGTSTVGPLVIHSSASSRELALRTSNRLYLRRCLLGGLERVYELGKCFENASHRDSLELTVLEWSAAYVDAHQVAHQAKELILHMAEAVPAGMHPQWRGHSIDLAGPWHTTTMRECISEQCGLDILESDCTALARHLPPGTSNSNSDWGALVNELYTTLVRPKIVQPTIVYDLPLAGQALTKPHPLHRELASSFGVVVGGVQVASGGTELNDPQEQRRRLASGDRCAWNCSSDEEVRLLEYGLCPAASARLSVDRVVMLLTGRDNLRDVIPFPLD
jgi:lysyl-tRNA synthetase, class II